MEQDLPLFARGPNGGITSPYLAAKGEEFNEWQKSKSRAIKAKEREIANDIYNWGQGIKSSTQKNLDTKGRKLTQTLNNIVNNIANSPEAQFIRDTGQLQKMAQVNADNHIGPAFQRVVDNMNRYYRTSPSGSDRGATAKDVTNAVNEYNTMLEQYGNNTTGWPKNDEGKFYWQDYMRYQDNKNGPIQYQYTVEGDKGNAILGGQRYENQEFKFQTQSGADLIKQMSNLTKQYNNQLELRKQNWQKRNELVQKGQKDSKEARAFLDEYFKYNNQATDTLNTLRTARDSYINLINNYKNGTL